MVICLEQGADLHMAQLMPLPLTVSCFSKIQIGFTFWYRLKRVVLEKGPLNGCVCVCVCVCVLSPPGERRSTPFDRWRCHIRRLHSNITLHDIFYFSNPEHTHKISTCKNSKRTLVLWLNERHNASETQPGKKIHNTKYKYTAEMQIPT